MAPQRSKKAFGRKPSVQWSDQEVPRRQRHESSSPRRRCLRCTLEPVKVTMNVRNNEDFVCREHQRAGRSPYPDFPPNQAPHYCSCECEGRHRPRTSSAPSAYATTRYRDVAVGSSDPMMVAHHGERRTALGGAPELFPRSQMGEIPYHPHGMGHDMEYPGITQRSRRPTKVYIYPVHPQTPPGSRSASPDRLFRRRGTIGGAPEEQLEYEPRDRRKSRDIDQSSAMGMTRFHSIGTSTSPAAGQAEASNLWPEEPASSDWVYRPLK